MKTVRLMEARGWIKKLDITPQEWSISSLGLQIVSLGEPPTGVLDVDRQLFAALIAGNFLLIDPSGLEITKPVRLAALASGQLGFEAIDPAECRVRLYLTAAAVTGLARIRGYFNARPFGVCGRYTHVYVEHNGGWRLITAQVTPIKEG